MARLPRDRVVIVTGASSGIGRATALAFARDGARVVVAARRKPEIDALAGEIARSGGRALAVPTDMTKRDEIRALVAATEREFGAVHVLVNNAGRGLYASVERTTDADFEAVMRLNVTAPFQAVQEVLPIMKRQGRGQIINVTSTLGRVAIPLMAVYCMSKFALTALSDSLRLEMRPHGIDVIVVGPGVTATGFQANAMLEGFDKPPAYENSAGASADRVGRAILRASKRRKRHVYLNLDSKALLFMHALSPRLTDFGMGIWMKRMLAKEKPPTS